MSDSNMRNMTEGSVPRHLLLFALPMFAGSVLQQLYNMVDSWVVGNYVGDGALAAVGAKVNPADDLNQQDVPNVLPTKLAELESRIGRLEVADQDLPPVPKKDAP